MLAAQLRGGYSQAKIRHPNVVFNIQQNIVRFDVSVNNLIFMGMLQSVQKLLKNIQRFLNRQRTMLVHIFFQATAFNIFHNARPQQRLHHKC